MKFSEVKEKWKCLALENYEVFGCGINLAVLKTIVLLNLQQFLSFRRFRALSASPAVFFFPFLCIRNLKCQSQKSPSPLIRYVLGFRSIWQLLISVLSLFVHAELKSHTARACCRPPPWLPSLRAFFPEIEGGSQPHEPPSLFPSWPRPPPCPGPPARTAAGAQACLPYSAGREKGEERAFCPKAPPFLIIY